MADSSEGVARRGVVDDWLACCGCENYVADFAKSGIDSIKKLRNLEKDQLMKIESSWWMEEKLCRLQDRTRTEEELSQEVSVSMFDKMWSGVMCSVGQVGLCISG